MTSVEFNRPFIQPIDPENCASHFGATRADQASHANDLARSQAKRHVMKSIASRQACDAKARWNFLICHPNAPSCIALHGRTPLDGWFFAAISAAQHGANNLVVAKLRYRPGYNALSVAQDGETLTNSG